MPADDTIASQAVFDVLAIGGGIFGAGVARDAAGRGAGAGLLEHGVLAQGTSSASTKLINDGLCYLEHHELSLLREALTEREILWRRTKLGLLFNQAQASQLTEYLWRE